MKEVYEKCSNIRLLISIRSDFADNLREVQERLNYILDANRNYFTLKKFTPVQTANIFKVIAEKENIKFVDISFLEKTASKELASKDDGLISPVDIQIISLVIKNNLTENQAFNAATFQRLGGIDGMLKRYIEDQLKVPNPFNRKGAVLHVLISLIDLNKNVSAGQLTIEEIRSKTAGELDNENMVKILDWLEQVKLINKVGPPPFHFELAHERLIDPLRNIGNETDTELRKANSLLARRSNEWIGNERSKRYLFNLKEILLIRKYSSTLTWGENISIKKQLVSNSIDNIKKRVFVLLCFFMLAIALVAFPRTAWYKLHFSLEKNIEYSITRGLAYSDRNKALDSLWKTDKEFALKILNNIKEDDLKTDAIDFIINRDISEEDVRRILPIVISLKSDNRKNSLFGRMIYSVSDKFLDEILSMANDLKGGETREILIAAIAKKLSIKDPLRSLQIADSLKDDNTRSDALVTIVRRINEFDVNRALIITRKITNKSDKATALAGIVGVISANDPARALQLVSEIEDNDTRDEALAKIAKTVAEKDVNRALKVIRVIQDEKEKNSALVDVIEVISEINLDEALGLVNMLTDADSKDDALDDISSELYETNPGRALIIINMMTDPEERDKSLSGLIDKTAESSPAKALQFAASMRNNSDKEDAITDIIKPLCDTDFDKTVLLVESISDRITHDLAIAAIIEGSYENKPTEILRLIRLIRTEQYRERALSNVVGALGTIDYTRALSLAYEMKDPDNRDRALQSIVENTAKTDPKRALRLAGEITNVEKRNDALSTIAVSIFRQDPVMSLEIVSTITREEESVMTRIAALLLEDKSVNVNLIDKVINYLKGIKNYTGRTEELIAICYMQKGDLNNSYNVINSMDDRDLKKAYSYINIYRAWKSAR